MANCATAGDGLIELSHHGPARGAASASTSPAAPRRGQTVALTTAQGTFTLPEVEPDHLLLISGGSGITPVMSMLRTRCALGWTKPVTFLHYALTESDMLYRDELEELAAHRARRARGPGVHRRARHRATSTASSRRHSSTAPPPTGRRRKPSSAVRPR